LVFSFYYWVGGGMFLPLDGVLGNLPL
jgi:hypothetical protein